MSSGERPIGVDKGKQTDTEALCHPPLPMTLSRGLCTTHGLSWRLSHSCRRVPRAVWATDEPMVFLRFVLSACCAHMGWLRLPLQGGGGGGCASRGSHTDTVPVYREGGGGVTPRPARTPKQLRPLLHGLSARGG